jgi:hypothetical protein
MAKSKPTGTLPKDVEAAYQLWTRGDYRAARKEARRVLAANPTDEEVRSRAQRVLSDTAPETRALQVGVGGIVFVVVILLLLFH